MKKTLSLVLALVMVALMLPIAAFTTSADDAVPYSQVWDFTKATPDAGTSGNITPNLPTGWVATDDANTELGHKKWTTTLNYDWKDNPHSVQDDVYEDEQKPIGVRLGGANMGIAMTDAAGLPAGIVDGTTDYTVTVKWNTTHKFAKIWWGWSGVDAETKLIKVPTKDSVAAADGVAFNATGGPSNVGKQFSDGPDNGANIAFKGTNAQDRQNEYGSQIGGQAIIDAFTPAQEAGAVFTTTLEVVGGKLVAVYVEAGGTTVKYLPSTDFEVKGYFSVWQTNWGDNNTVNIRSVEIKEGTIAKVQFPEVSNTQTLQNVDFTAIKTDAALADAGFVVSSIAPTDPEKFVPNVSYADDGLALKLGTNDFLINKAVELNNKDSYIIDFTYKMNPSVWIWAAEFGFTNAMLEGDAATVNAALLERHGFADGNCSLKMRANEGDNKLACDSWTYYKDGTWMEAESSGTYNPSATAVEAACGEAKESIRVRILVSKGTAQFAFMTIGEENFYLKRNSPMTQDSIAGLFGFTFVGSAKEARGVTLQNFSITQCDLGDTTGGTEIKAELEKAYTDAAATYYKDGYILHYMNFEKATDWASTNYSFASNSSLERIVKVEDGVLKFTNSGSKAAYLMFTANAIPAAITEYTASYDFRFVGETNDYFGFLRGISLKEDGARDKHQAVEISFKKGEVTDCATADTAAWEAIVTAMKAGEWVNVTVSNVGRYVESVTVVCGENMATFTMDAEENKLAPDGYMGFIIGKTTAVEVKDIVVMAGKVDNITMPTWPTGLEMGALVQNVTAEAVAEGTKPDYTDKINELLGTGNNNNNNNTEETTTAATTTAATTTAATTAAAKKGCKNSIVAVPAIIATAIFGCAVVCKKKED